MDCKLHWMLMPKVCRRGETEILQLTWQKKKSEIGSREREVFGKTLKKDSLRFFFFFVALSELAAKRLRRGCCLC
jgi:hypothetical protein